MRSSILAAALLATVLPAVSSAAMTYGLDDGSGESGLGGFNVTFYWLNGYTSSAGGEYLDKVQIAFGANGADPASVNGTPITVGIWSDPNDDGNPNDAVLESSILGVISGFTNTQVVTATNFVDFNFASSVNIPAGEKFFVGFGYYLSGNVFGAARDTDTNAGNSWAYRWNSDNPVAAANLASADVKNNYNDILGGNAMIRAVGQAVPEPSGVLLSAIGLLSVGFIRRRPC